MYTENLCQDNELPYLGLLLSPPKCILSIVYLRGHWLAYHGRS